MIAISAGICVLWPMVRLSQELPRGRRFGSALLDVLVVGVPVQMVLWPLSLLAGWPLEGLDLSLSGEGESGRLELDARGLGDLSLADRWKLSSRMRDNRRFIARSAVFGLGTAQRFMLKVILRASGRDDLRAFERRDDAETWLLEHTA